MDQNLLIILTVFVAVAAIALIIQAGLLLGIYKSSKSITENLQRLMPKIDSLLETSRATVDESRKQIAEISTRTNDILDVTRRQLHRLDEGREDATRRPRQRVDRAGMARDVTRGRV